MEKKDIGEDAR